MNANKLKGKIVERGTNVEKLAEYLGMDKSTLYRKLSAAEKITIGEALRIKTALDLTDEEAYDIFLA